MYIYIHNMYIIVIPRNLKILICPYNSIVEGQGCPHNTNAWENYIF